MANDLISRAAAIEAALDGVDDWDGGCNPSCEEYIRGHMAKVPAVDATPIVYAEWVKENDRVNHWHCSNCDNVFGQVVYFYKFCPFCGAATTVKDQTNL